MNDLEMRIIRQRLQLDRLQFARLLGYTGTDRNDITRIRKYETGKQQIPLYMARLVWLIDSLIAEARKEPPELWPEVVTDDGLSIDWPEWPGYEFSHNPDPDFEESTRGPA